MRFAALTFAALLPLGAAADGPVVVELYTSQGCSSCPPADALLAELAGHADVIALGLHVDYWDYIGWADPFALPGNAERQRAYAKRAGERMVYTPQIVIDGMASMPGNRARAVRGAIETRLDASTPGPDIALVREGGALVLYAGRERRPEGALEVMLATWDPAHSTHITAGENAGGWHDYANVVTRLDHLGTWQGDAALRITLDAAPPLAVLLQRAGPGEIVAAAKLD